MEVADPIFIDEQHRALRQQVREFAEREVRPRIAHLEATGEIERDLVAEIAARGWIGVTIPGEYGGLRETYGGGHVAKVIIIEELSRVCGAIGAATQAAQLGVAKIIHFGGTEQRHRWLPAIAAGKILPTVAVTEPASGGHVLGMTGTAERDGDGYVINARKTFVGDSHIGDLHGVVVRTGGADAGSKALSAFLVAADLPGVRLEPLAPAIGLKGFSFGEIVFQDCRVPAEALLGAVGDGLAVAYSSSVLYGRPNLGAVSFGIHRAIAEDSAAFSGDRELYGAPIAQIGTIKAALGQMASRLATAAQLLYAAARLLDLGLPCDQELINAKVVNAEAAVASADAAMRIFAARGLLAEHRIERYLRDAYSLLPPAGTSDIQWVRLAEHALGQDGHVPWSQRFAHGTPPPAVERAGRRAVAKVADVR